MTADPKRRESRKFRRFVAHAAIAQPWLVHPGYLTTIRNLVAAHRAGRRVSLDDARAQLGFGGEESGLRIVGRVAVIPIEGVITQRASFWTRLFGGTSTEEFSSAIRQATANPEVDAIVLNVNSPGGTAAGVAEAAAAVIEARGQKRVVAVANTLMCSAAYWLSSGAAEIVASPSAVVGSIGAVLVLTEASRLFDSEGITNTVITHGALKAAGNPYEPLSAEARASAQLYVDDVGAQFVRDVAAARGITPAEVEANYGQGQAFLGDRAMAAGLVDRVATLEQILAELSTPSLGRTATTQRTSKARTEGTSPKSPDRAPQGPATFFRKGFTMNEAIRSALIKLGLIGEHSSEALADVALRSWYVAAGKAIPESDEQVLADLAAAKPAKPRTPVVKPDDDGDNTAALLKAVTDGAKAEAKRRKAILAQCALLDIPAAKAEEFVDLGLSAQDTKAEIADFLAVQKPKRGRAEGTSGQRIEPTEAEPEKLAEAVKDALRIKVTAGGGAARQYAPADWKPTQAGREMANRSILGIGRELLTRCGCRVNGLTDPQLAVAMLDFSPQRVHALGGDAFYTPANFPNLYAAVSGDSLVRGFSEAPVNWRLWTTPGGEVGDFKPHSRVKFGEADDLDEVPSGDKFPEANFSDAKEVLVVATYGKKFSITPKMLLGDELGALGRVPNRLGSACSRTINKLCVETLVANPAMADGVTLFHAGTHKNVVAHGAGGVPSVVQLGKVENLMSLQTGLQSDAILNIPLRFIMVPSALSLGARQLLMSVADPVDNKSSEVKNPYYGKIDAIKEPILDGYSTAYWYGIADPAVIDTMEVAFLSGESTPVLSDWFDPDTENRFLKVKQTFGLVPIHHQAFVFNDGD